MLHFYDGQIRRYLIQVIRLFSNFTVKQGDGTLIKIPVIYGDIDRQVANIINQNSENAVISAPKISISITDLELDRSRLSDATYVGKLHIRERNIENGEYTSDQGLNYTVERLMPTPYNLSLRMDIWSSNSDQKLQILEQILVLFNPSLEIQTNDNYVDWTSLSVLDINDITFSSRSIPMGTATAIDIATVILQTPIWISPPVKVKKMGIITSIIASLYTGIEEGEGGYIDGLGNDTGGSGPGPISTTLIAQKHETIGNYDIFVEGKTITALDQTNKDRYLSWSYVVEQYPGNYTPGLTKIFLIQPDGTEVLGYVSINILDETVMVVSTWDPDTFPSNTPIPSNYRSQHSLGSFDAIIDPTKTVPSNLYPGFRYLIVEGIGGGYRDTFISDINLTKLITPLYSHKVNYYTVLVDDLEVESHKLEDPIFSNMQVRNISGDGSGAIFDITCILSTQLYSASLVESGSGYEVDDKVKVRGVDLGGENIDNDCVITVKSVDTNGGILTYRVHGSSPRKNFTIVFDTIVPANSKISYELFVNEDGPDAWKNSDGSDFIAEINDIIEWDGQNWHVVFEAGESSDLLIYQTNLHTMTQYKWNGVQWSKSFEGLYKRGQWRIVL